jgi:hypothetical protein
MPPATPMARVDHSQEPYQPRRPSGAYSTTKAVAPAASPPTESPWAARNTTSSTGASTPMAACPGSSPMPAVAAAISTMTVTSTWRRPTRSPSRPNSTAPTGRARNAVANTAKLADSPAIGSAPGK